MNFDLTQERQMLQDSLRRFLRERYGTGVRNEILAGDAGMSPQIWQELADLGVIGALFDDSIGGFGGGGFDLAVVFEELGRVGVVEPFLDTGVLAGGLIADVGDAAQKAMIADVIAGRMHLAFAHGEPASRYDLNRVETTAKAQSGQIVLSGRKAVVVNAEAADMLIVSARESGAVYDQVGISLFVVPRETAGVIVQGYGLVAGGRAGEVLLEDVRLRESARLGRAGQMFEAIEARVAAASVAQCAQTLGTMETAVALTQEYLMTRKQFGCPIGSF
ncbi:Caffeyl-CoA reductase-Etf complex subunit CarC [Roseobacter fucihabitans]|uniref:Caffeyl-CoA reductase-Etf complex subunit CarC n=1 Tax=Roseobacter fucihabitans TaxID=1537242 RepID=A0ABZ2BW69_9RHOB|nr:Acyl-CoA dehydrogenase fadE12 [Roseobacter litoralis]